VGIFLHKLGLCSGRRLRLVLGKLKVFRFVQQHQVREILELEEVEGSIEIIKGSKFKPNFNVKQSGTEAQIVDINKYPLV